MRIATWNVNSLKARLPRVEEWLEYAQPDVLCMQETKLADAAFPVMPFAALGYEAAHHGDGRWNGVAIAQPGRARRRRGRSPRRRGRGRSRPGSSSATCGGVRVASVYVPNGRSLDSEHYAAKLEWLARLRRLAGRHRRQPVGPAGRCAATSTSPPTTATSTTRPSSSAPPT